MLSEVGQLQSPSSRGNADAEDGWMALEARTQLLDRLNEGCRGSDLSAAECEEVAFSAPDPDDNFLVASPTVSRGTCLPAKLEHTAPQLTKGPTVVNRLWMDLRVGIKLSASAEVGATRATSPAIAMTAACFTVNPTGLRPPEGGSTLIAKSRFFLTGY